MLRARSIWFYSRLISQSQFRFCSTNKFKLGVQEVLTFLGNLPSSPHSEPIVSEQRQIANVVHNSASLLEELQANGSQFKHIIGSVPMPLLLINRLDSDEILCYNSDISLFNFIIRTHYQPLYEKCRAKRNGIIGTPGIAKSVSLLYPLLDHILKSKNSPDSSPVLLHSVSGDEAYLFFDGSCWNIPKFMSSPELNQLHRCLIK